MRMPKEGQVEGEYWTIQHLHEGDPKNGWAYSNYDGIASVVYNKAYKCWAKTGCLGFLALEEGLDALNKVRKYNFDKGKKHIFRLAKVTFQIKAAPIKEL